MHEKGIGQTQKGFTEAYAQSLSADCDYTAKHIRRFYGKITGNQLPVYFPFFLRVPVNIFFRNQAQYGSKKTCSALGHIALKP